MKSKIFLLAIVTNIFFALFQSSILYAASNLDIINSFFKSKGIKKAEILVDSNGYYHIIYWKYGIPEDDFDHVFYYVLDTTGEVLTNQEIGKYLGPPRDFKIGTNSEGNFFVFYLDGIPDGNLHFSLFDHSGNILRNTDSLAQGGYFVSTDNSGNIFLIAGVVKKYFMVIDSKGSRVSSKDITTAIRPLGKSHIGFKQMEILGQNSFLLVGTPLDYTKPNKIIYPEADKIGFSVFDAKNLTFSTPQEVSLKDAAEDTVDARLQLVSEEPGLDPPLEIFKSDFGVVVFATERNGEQIGSSYKIRFNSNGEIIKNTSQKLARLQSMANASTAKFALRYVKVTQGRGPSATEQEYLIGVDPSSNVYYLERR